MTYVVLYTFPVFVHTLSYAYVSQNMHVFLILIDHTNITVVCSSYDAKKIDAVCWKL